MSTLVPETFDCMEAVNAIYEWMEKNSKKIIKGDKVYSDVFFQIYCLSKKTYSEEPYIYLGEEDREILIEDLVNLGKVLAELKKKKSNHWQAWELLENLTDSEVKSIRQKKAVNVIGVYYILLNVWICFENWDRNSLKIVFPAAHAIAKVQAEWPSDEESYRAILKCIYKCFGGACYG